MNKAAEGEPLLAAEALTLRRGLRDILCDVTVSVGNGDFVCITGPNGAGKTTLLRCLLGFLRPSRGRVLLEGRLLEEYGQRACARMMAYVPQVSGDLGDFTVEDFVLLGRYPHWSSFSNITTEDRRIVRNALEQTSLSAASRQCMTSLSAGERQRAFIAAALAQGARILLLDEPTAFLDPRHLIETVDLIGRLNSERCLTIVMITHDINLAARFAHRVIALRDGSVVYDGEARRFLTRDVLEPLYGTRFEVLCGTHGQSWAVPEAIA